MYKNDKVIRRYSEPFKLKILAKLSTGKYTKSELGEIGLIKAEWIDFIDSYKFSGTDTIRIAINEKFKKEFKNRMNRKMSELYLKNNGADIIIFQSESLMPLSELLDLLKSKLKK